MGPIERELRSRAALRSLRIDQLHGVSFVAFSVLWDAERSLGVSGPMRFSGKTDLAQLELDGLWPDIYSEAIEAAEALGL